MKRILAIILLFCLNYTFSQTTKTITGSFEIINNSSPDKADFYSESILKSNLETYRLKDERVTLEFKNGFQLVLLSAKELFLKGVKVDVSAYRESTAQSAPLPLFIVLENGWIGAEVKSTAKSAGK